MARDFYLNMTKNVRIALESMLYEQLVNGIIPWHKKFKNGIPYSLISGKQYDFKNRCLLPPYGGGYGTKLHYEDSKCKLSSSLPYSYCIHSCNVKPGMLHQNYERDKDSNPRMLHTKYYKVWSADDVPGYNNPNKIIKIEHADKDKVNESFLKSYALEITRDNLVEQMCYFSMSAELHVFLPVRLQKEYVKQVKEFYLQFADPEASILTMALYEADKLYRREVKCK